MSKKILIDQSVLEQALLALRIDDLSLVRESVIALRAALEQPPVVEQEPVAVIGDVWTLLWAGGEPIAEIVKKHSLRIGDLLYTRPQPRHPLTDEQIQEAATKANREGKLSWTGFQLDNNGEYTIPSLSLCHYQLARAIECAHGIDD